MVVSSLEIYKYLHKDGILVNQTSVLNLNSRSKADGRFLLILLYHERIFTHDVVQNERHTQTLNNLFANGREKCPEFQHELNSGF